MHLCKKKLSRKKENVRKNSIFILRTFPLLSISLGSFDWIEIGRQESRYFIILDWAWKTKSPVKEGYLFLTLAKDFFTMDKKALANFFMGIDLSK